MLLLGIILFLLAISLHELGHAFMMRRYGVPIHEISLLGFGPRLFSFRLTRWFGQTPITVRLIPLGAFVSLDDASIKKLARKQRMHIYAAGIVMNLFFTAFLTLVIGIMLTVNNPWYWVLIASLALVGVLIRFFPTLCIPIGLALVGLIAHDLISDPRKFQSESGSVVAIIEEAGKQSKIKETGKIVYVWDDKIQLEDIARVINFGAAISIALATMNTLPILPLDGGRIALTALLPLLPRRKRPKARNIFVLASSATFLSLIVSALWADGERIFQFFSR